MIQAALALYFVIEFYRKANASNKNPWIWALVGGLCFFTSSFTATQVLAMGAAYSGFRSGAFIAILFISIAAGLLFGYWVTRKVQSKYLQSPDETHSLDIISPVQDSNQLSGIENETQVYCKSCRWRGTGEELHQKDSNPGNFIYCPNCENQVSLA